jgi:hypothetical protein
VGEFGDLAKNVKGVVVVGQPFRLTGGAVGPQAQPAATERHASTSVIAGVVCWNSTACIPTSRAATTFASISSKKTSSSGRTPSQWQVRCLRDPPKLASCPRPARRSRARNSPAGVDRVLQDSADVEHDRPNRHRRPPCCRPHQGAATRPAVGAVRRCPCVALCGPGTTAWPGWRPDPGARARSAGSPRRSSAHHRLVGPAAATADCVRPPPGRGPARPNPDHHPG